MLTDVLHIETEREREREREKEKESGKSCNNGRVERPRSQLTCNWTHFESQQRLLFRIEQYYIEAEKKVTFL